MGVTTDDIADAVESGSPDRVNAVIDELDDLDKGERIAVFEDCFDRCRELYGEVDGYGRQSVVRILNSLNPALILAVFTVEGGGEFPSNVNQDRYREAVTDLRDFLLTALQDDDGRVRQASKRALKEVCVGYDMMGENEPIESIVKKLEALKTEVDDDEVRSHIEDAQEQAEFYLQSPASRLLKGLADELSELNSSQ